MLGLVPEVSAPSQMQGLCRGCTRLLTRDFGLCTLEIVELLQEPAWLEHGPLNRQNLVPSHRGTCWDKSKCPNSDLHRLKTRARGGSVGRAVQRQEGCQVTYVALGMVLCALLWRPRGQDRPRAGGKAHLLLQELPPDVPRRASPDLADFWKAKARRAMLSHQRLTTQHPLPTERTAECAQAPPRPEQTFAPPGLPSCLLDCPTFQEARPVPRPGLWRKGSHQLCSLRHRQRWLEAGAIKATLQAQGTIRQGSPRSRQCPPEDPRYSPNPSLRVSTAHLHFILAPTALLQGSPGPYHCW